MLTSLIFSTITGLLARRIDGTKRGLVGLRGGLSMTSGRATRRPCFVRRRGGCGAVGRTIGGGSGCGCGDGEGAHGGDGGDGRMKSASGALS